MQCLDCLPNQSSFNERTECRCDPGFKKQDKDQLGFSDGCVACPEASSQDRLECLVCEATTSSFDAASQECVCNDETHFLMEYQENGSRWADDVSGDLQKRCISCAANFYWDTTRCT
jgi:hypothetical protein